MERLPAAPTFQELSLTVLVQTEVGDNAAMNVLILEDEFLLAMMLADEVKDAGHNVIGPVATTAEAVCLAECTPIDVALLNLDLSQGAGGGQAATVLKQRWNTPCLFVSGNREEAEKHRSFAVGFLEKPYSGDTLREALGVVQQVMQGQVVSSLPFGMTLFSRCAVDAGRR